MTNLEDPMNYGQGIASEINVRINDLEERTNNTGEKINLVSKNFIFLKEEIEQRVLRIEKENNDLKKELSSLKKSISNFSQESEKWVRRDEVVLIERMLKDFQPLEFLRKKDFREMLKKEKELNEGMDSEKNKQPRFPLRR